jgi:hypothetical protein
MTNPCTEKTALLMAYTHATKIYYEAVTSLSQTETRSQLEFRQLKDLAEESRKNVEAARNAMDLHIRTHGC